MKVTNDQLHDLFSAFEDIAFLKKSLKITKKLVENKDFEEYTDVLKPFIGYTLHQKKVGDHKNDGQFVEYTWTFTNSKGKKTTICTDMCLVAGWDLPKNTYQIK